MSGQPEAKLASPACLAALFGAGGRNPCPNQNAGFEIASCVVVNAIAPTVVMTLILDRCIPHDEIEATVAEYASFHPLGRLVHT